MKTTCFALLALVGVASSMYPIRKPGFLPAEELREGPVNTMHPMEPARHVFPKAPTVPFHPVCPAEGYFRDPYNCGKFYHCNDRNAVSDPFYCEPTGFIFDMRTNRCTSPESAFC